MLERWTSTWALRLGAATLAFSLVGCSSDDPPAPAGGGGGDETPGEDGGKPTSSTNRDAGGATLTPKGDAGGSTTTPPKDAGGKPPTGSPDGGGTAPATGTDGGGTVTVDPGKCDATAAPDVGKLGLQTVPGATGLTKLVFAAQPPGSTDWYFVEQAGSIKVLTGGAIKPTPFLNLASMISLVSAGFDDERGLLGLAFPPDYAASGKFYVMMTPTGNRDTVYEFKRSAADPYVADPAPTKTVVALETSALNHNCGNVTFGKDGMLYVGTGDGGGMCNSDQPGAPQDTKKLFGKILRLDPNAAAAPYAAPGNPFADGSGGDARVWMYGLRNPYRFSFDRATDDLYIGDVGQDGYEELDYVAAGGKGLNFGWPGVEGLHPGTCAGRSLPAGAMPTAPIFEADRRRGQTNPYADWISIIGGHVYRGSALPQLSGVYLFGDYRGARMVALRQCGTTTSPLTPILKRADPNQAGASFKSVGGAPALTDLTAIVTDNDGELYFVANRNTLLKVVPGQ